MRFLVYLQLSNHLNIVIINSKRIRRIWVCKGGYNVGLNRIQANWNRIITDFHSTFVELQNFLTQIPAIGWEWNSWEMAKQLKFYHFRRNSM